MSSETQTNPKSKLRRTAQPFGSGAKSLPQKYFVSAEIFTEEQRKIFSRQWLLVGHQSQIAKQGDYLLIEVGPSSADSGVRGAGPESLIIIRGKDEQVRGFFNVCRHRGTRLIECGNGQSSAGIQCPYHAWTYGLDGRLIGAPHMDEVPGFDKADYSLHSVDLRLFEGFMFLNLGKDSIAIEKWFAPLADKFAHWNLPNLRSAKRIEYDVGANWKLVFENYSECYHCPGVHPMLSKVSPYDSAENDLTEGPFLGGFMKINKGKSLTMSGNACAISVGGKEAEGEAEGEGNGERVFYYSIFPNMLLSMHPEYVMVHQLWPKSPERTLIVCDWLFHPDAFARSDFTPEDAINFWDMTNRQDWHVCELSQQGIGSRAYRPGPYSSRESIPAAWDREYLRQMNNLGRT